MAKILAIEDEAPLLEEIIDMLTFEGFEAIGAENGQVGVQMAQEHLPDLILCDIMMPVMDGFSTLVALRSEPQTAMIPFIFLTAKAEKRDMRTGMELGANDYLTKPFSQEELLSAVKTRLAAQEALEQHYDKKLGNLRSTIVHTLPHELRTPLVAILGFGELLMMDADTLTAEQIFEMAEAIVKGGNRLHRLIENYLLYAQIESAATDKHKIKALRKNITENSQEIIDDIAKKQAALAEREDDLVLETDNIPLQISEDSLGKIVEELVSNAFKFSEAGTEVRVSTTVDGDTFALSVDGKGRGMTPEQIEEIDAYVQFDRALYEQQGSGLGLIIAKRLAELHGGELMIESTPEQETKVYVRLDVG